MLRRILIIGEFQSHAAIFFSGFGIVIGCGGSIIAVLDLQLYLPGGKSNLFPICGICHSLPGVALRSLITIVGRVTGVAFRDKREIVIDVEFAVVAEAGIIIQNIKVSGFGLGETVVVEFYIGQIQIQLAGPGNPGFGAGLHQSVHKSQRGGLVKRIEAVSFRSLGFGFEKLVAPDGIAVGQFFVIKILGIGGHQILLVVSQQTVVNHHIGLIGLALVCQIAQQQQVQLLVVAFPLIDIRVIS